MKEQSKQKSPATRIFTDGSGSRPDGMGSGFAWLRESDGKKHITRENGLTNNQAEYKAILSALDESVEPGANLEILTDSENTCFQLRGERRVRDPHLAKLHAEISAVIETKRLVVAFTWIPRRENRAGKLI